jgi:hypothetical protein
MKTKPLPIEKNEQAPLGPEPTYDQVLDTAVEYTFPCSDPIAVETCCDSINKRAKPPAEQPSSS